MMGSQMIVGNSYLPSTGYSSHRTNRQLTRQVQQHLQNMQVQTAVGEAAIEEISNLHGYAQFKVAATLNTSHMFLEARRAQGTSKAEEAAYERLEQQYLNAIGHVTNIIDTKIILNVQALALPDANDTRDDLDRFVDGLLGR